MPDREVSIYPPVGSVNWGSTVLGEFKSLLSRSSLVWCWATKYTPEWHEDPTHHGTPEKFAVEFHDGKMRGCFVKIRYRSTDVAAFETDVQTTVDRLGWHAHFADFDVVQDLGSDRFVPEEQLSLPTEEEQGRREQRADLLVSFLYHGLMLALDALVFENNEWRFENNTHAANPTGTTFQSVVHLICNLTDARTIVRVQTPLGITEVEASF